MKFARILIILSLPLGILGCANDAKDVATEKVIQESTEAYDAIKAYATIKKQEFQRKVEATMDSYEKQIQALQSKAEKASGDAKQKYDEALAHWNKKREALIKQLDEFKSASADAWEDVEQRIEASIKELKMLYEEAKSSVT